MNRFLRITNKTELRITNVQPGHIRHSRIFAIRRGARKRGGFTLIETLIAVAILVILVVIITSALASFREAATLDGAVDETLELLREARAKTLSSEGASGYGVHFESASVILFRKFKASGGYDDADSTNIVIALPYIVEISSIDFGITTTTQNVFFERLSGETKAYGSVTFRTKRSLRIRQIQIFASGLFSRL